MKKFLILSIAALSGQVHGDCALLRGCGNHSLSIAPISVMGDHLHKHGEWMFSFRHMHMDMDGMYNGSNSVAPSAVHAANYVVSPTRMTMEMQMLGAMYAPSDDLTLMAMISYIQNDMDHVIEAGTPLVGLNNGSDTFSTRSVGMADLKLSALFRLMQKESHHVHASFGISLPTGTISNTDIAPGPGGRLSRQLPAAMQPGSGTFDLLPSLTYLYHGSEWSAGVQARGVFRTGENHHNYRMGHRAEVDAWFGCKPFNWLSVNSGLGLRWEGELDGTQSDVIQNPPFAPTRRLVPTVFGGNYGGMQLDAMVGVNLLVAQAHRVGLDVRVPLWQDVNGYRLGQDVTATIGWSTSF